MTRKHLLQKIKKCLALAASANENEAAAALSKARALMEEHAVDEAELGQADIEEATARAARTMRPPTWESYLVSAVTRALGVVGYIDGHGDRCFVGRGASAEIARYSFSVLFRLLKRQRAHYIKVTLRRCTVARKRQRADAFSQAWACAVAAKVAELSPLREPDDALQQYLAERHPGLVTVASRKASTKGGRLDRDYWNGHAAGSRVDLNNGIGAQSAPLMIA